MSLKQSHVMTWWRAAIVVVASAGLLTGDNGIVFFTTESSVIVVGYYLSALFGGADRPWRTPAPRLRGAVTSWILITGILYHFVVVGGADPIPGLFAADAGAATQNWSNFLLHYVAPPMVLIDWLATGPRRLVRWRDGVLWLAYPIGYFALMLVRGVLLPDVADRFPYPFLDPTIAGWDGLVWGVIPIVLSTALITAAVIACDRMVGGISPRTTR